MNKFKFGDRVIVPGCTSSRLVTEVIGDSKIRVCDLVEITPKQRAEWTAPPLRGQLKFIPGMVIQTRGIKLA